MFVMVPVLFVGQRQFNVLQQPHLIVSVVAGVHVTIFTVIGIGLSIDALSSPVESGQQNYFGWAVYWSIEIYGSVVETLLW
ncbi:hypothetical protein SARC_17786, partial [Sphaeroforma arctica JP610]